MEAQRQLDDTVLIVVRWGFESFIASKKYFVVFHVQINSIKNAARL